MIQHVIIYVLLGVDAAALAVGLTILRRVTKQVHETADAIRREVNGAINQAEQQAVGAFINAATPALAMVAQTVPTILRDGLETVAKSLRIRGDGRVEITTSEEDDGVRLEVVSGDHTTGEV